MQKGQELQEFLAGLQEEAGNIEIANDQKAAELSSSIDDTRPFIELYAPKGISWERQKEMLENKHEYVLI